jgi:prepilin-type N-terminal cleavage/methylation domain-containing protein
MRRQRGFTMIELMGSLAIIGSVSVVAGGLAVHATHLRDLGAAYAADVSESRRALDAFEADVRSAHDVASAESTCTVTRDAGVVVWTLSGQSLRRGDAVLARNVASFGVRRDGSLVTAVITLGRRSPDARDTACVETAVAMRAARESAK